MISQKNRRLFTVLAIIAATTYAIIAMSRHTYPLEAMAPKPFSSLFELGAKIYSEFEREFTREPLVVFGVTPSIAKQKEIVEGFIAAAKQNGHPITIVYKETGLENLSVPAETQVVETRFGDTPFELADRVREQTKAEGRVLIYTANIFSSKLVSDNQIHRFEAAWGGPVTALSAVGIALKSETPYKTDPPCLGSERDGAGTAALGCAASLKSRQLYRLNLDDKKVVGVVDRRGEHDLLLYVNAP